MEYEELDRIMREAEGCMDNVSQDISLIDEIQPGEWISTGKYETLRDNIIVDYETGKYYKIIMTRGGSYYSDYEHYYQGLQEVIPVETTIITWKGVSSV